MGVSVGCAGVVGSGVEAAAAERSGVAVGGAVGGIDCAVAVDVCRGWGGVDVAGSAEPLLQANAATRRPAQRTVSIVRTRLRCLASLFISFYTRTLLARVRHENPSSNAGLKLASFARERSTSRVQAKMAVTPILIQLACLQDNPIERRTCRRQSVRWRLRT